jgi:hypothetical protein
MNRYTLKRWLTPPWRTSPSRLLEHAGWRLLEDAADDPELGWEQADPDDVHNAIRNWLAEGRSESEKEDPEQSERHEG